MTDKRLSFSHHTYCQIILHSAHIVSLTIHTYLINFIEPNDPVEGAIQVVQQIHHLHRSGGGTEFSEPDDIAEVYCHAFEAFWLDHFTSHQLLGYRPGWR